LPVALTWAGHRETPQQYLPEFLLFVALGQLASGIFRIDRVVP